MTTKLTATSISKNRSCRARVQCKSNYYDQCRKKMARTCVPSRRFAPRRDGCLACKSEGLMKTDCRTDCRDRTPRLPAQKGTTGSAPPSRPNSHYHLTPGPTRSRGAPFGRAPRLLFQLPLLLDPLCPSRPSGLKNRSQTSLYQSDLLLIANNFCLLT